MKMAADLVRDMVAVHLLFSEDDTQQTKEKILNLLLILKNTHKNINYEYLESLSAITTFLFDEVPNREIFGTQTREQWISDILDIILFETCIPTLYTSSQSSMLKSGKEKAKIYQLTYALISEIVVRGFGDKAENIWNLVLKSWGYFLNDCNSEFSKSEDFGSDNYLLVGTALDLTGYLLHAYNEMRDSLPTSYRHFMEMKETIFDALLNLLAVVQKEGLVFKITRQIFPKLLSQDHDTLYLETKKIWESLKNSRLKDLNMKPDSPGLHCLYALLSSLADLYFKERNVSVFKIHLDPIFWSLLQTGLAHMDSLVRKRSLYLLQSAVALCKDKNDIEEVYFEETSLAFWWHAEFSEEIFAIWQHYVFFLEILEEKQLHVIQPVLSHVEDLVNAARKTKERPFPLLPLSWLKVIVHRAAIHENRFIKKWGITILLTLNLEELSVLDDDVTRNFIGHTFIMLLKEPTLYAKNYGEARDEPSLLTKHLLHFFRRCFVALAENQRKVFLTQIMDSVSHLNISHVPLTFIAESLSHVPKFAVFDSELFHIMRNIIMNVASHSILLRCAIKTSLLKTFLNLLNPSCARVEEIVSFFGLFTKEESLCRGSKLWHEVSIWFGRNHLLINEVKDLFWSLSNRIQSFLKDESTAQGNERAQQLAKYILLCYDCSAITLIQMKTLLHDVSSMIEKAQSNVYHSVSSCWSAVHLLCALCHELLPRGESERHANTDDITSVVFSTVLASLHNVTLVLLRSLSQEDEYCCFYGYKAFIMMLHEMEDLLLMCKFQKTVQVSLNKLAKLACSSIIHEMQCKCVKHWLQFLASLKLCVWVIDITAITDYVINEEVRSDVLNCSHLLSLTSNLRLPRNPCDQDELNCLKEVTWHNVAEDIIATKWHFMNIVLKERSGEIVLKCHSSNITAVIGNEEVVEACIEALSLSAGTSCYSCLETLEIFLPKLIECDGKATAILLLEAVWSVLTEIRTRYSGDFWPAMDIVVKIVFSVEMLSLRDDNELVHYVRTYWNSLFRLADDQTGVVAVIVSHLCQVFSKIYHNQAVDTVFHAYHLDIIADICVFGPVHKKDLKLLLDTSAYVKHRDEHSGTWNFSKLKECENELAHVRVDLLAFLLNDRFQSCSSLFMQLLRVLLQRNGVLSAVKASHFLNSENHRKKQRLWQTLLVLMPKIIDKKFASEISGTILKSLEGDNQTSVRFLMEWCLVKLFSHHLHLLERIWEDLRNVYKTRLGYIASLISIVAHVFLTLDEPEAQMNYLQRFIPVVIPCAFLNHSQIRAYILASLQLISENSVEEVWRNICLRYPTAESCLLFTRNVFEGEKEKARLQKDRDLFSLHPVKDFSLEVIFQTVPLITGVVNDEVISPRLFLTQGSESWVEVSTLPLYRRNNAEVDILGSDNTTEDNVSIDAARNDDRTNGPASKHDFQKKITPWNVIPPPENDDEIIQRPLDRHIGDLIVVASLIDRAPNLGGLCRTCEIFGVSTLVLATKHVVSEKDFKAVSVSSEKWVDIEEVKIHDLEKYLLRMKNEGFTIVGVEQTTQSTKLTKFQFPRSTVLVLGNEKSGIPSQIIQLLDECVEITQYGIIRSLNVHVSGALLIWEYSRQHLAKV